MLGVLIASSFDIISINPIQIQRNNIKFTDLEVLDSHDLQNHRNKSKNSTYVMLKKTKQIYFRSQFCIVALSHILKAMSCFELFILFTHTLWC